MACRRSCAVPLWLSLKVRPAGNITPPSSIDAVGKPAVVIRKLPNRPVEKVVVAPLVMVGG